MVDQPKFSVAIIGGGIGGVTLALSLSKHSNDIQFDLYEAASGFHEVGAGVGIFARSLTALIDLGIADELEKIATPSALSDDSFDYRKSDIAPKGKWFARRTYPVALRGGGNYHRSEFLNLLTSLLPDKTRREHIHFNKRFKSYEQGSKSVNLYFEDGTHAICDVLIGADGIKSPTRYAMYRELASLESTEEGRNAILNMPIPVWSGMVAYRGLVNTSEVEAVLGKKHRCAKERAFYCGRGRHLVVFPIAMGKKINVVAFVSAGHDSLTHEWPKERAWVEDGSADEMMKKYEGFEDEAIALLKCIPKPSTWAIHQLDPLPFYAHQNVAILGDAAHATQPHQGQGANQSIEDAYILSSILSSSHTTKDNIPLALGAYEHARKPRANEVIRLSERSGKMHQFLTEPFENLEAFKEIVENELYNGWLFTGHCKEDAENALTWMLEQDKPIASPQD